MKGITLPKRIIVAAALLGWSFDLFFYGKALGISLLLFVLLALAVLIYLGRSKAIRPKFQNLWLLLPLLFCAGMVAVRTNPFLTFLNVVATLFLMEFAVHFFTSGRLERLGFFEYPLILSWVAAQSTVQAAPLISMAVDVPSASRKTKRNLLPVARGLLLALPILIVFTLFLVSADQVFAAYVNSVFTLNVFDRVIELTWRSLLIFVVTWIAAGGLAYGLLHQSVGRGSRTVQQMTGFLRRRPSLGFTEAAVILSLINGLFLTFVWVQFAYLFGGRANIRVDGFTYAEYARRGFFELVFVALMTLALILGLHWLTTRAGRRQTFLFNGLSTMMSLLVMVMLVSAFQRLLLYEMAYGYTWLRLWVHTFMIWLGFVFVWFLLTLWLFRRPPPESDSAETFTIRTGIPGHFAFGVFLAAIGFLTTLNLINPDQFITRQNLARFEETGDLDVYYLASLSNDALPALVPALLTMPEDYRLSLCADLYRRQESVDESESWLSFNVGRYQARQLLTHDDWKAYCPPVEELYEMRSETRAEIR